MKHFEGKKSIFAGYLFFIFLSLVVFFINRFVVLTPLAISLTFLLVIFLPGFCLNRLIKIKNDSYLSRLIYMLALGLIFNLLICFLAILFELTITILVGLILVLYVVIFIVAFLSDYFNQNKQDEIKSSWKLLDILKWENLIYLFLFVFVILVLITVNQLGINFTGDPFYHLALMRKALESQSLSMANLSYVNGETHIAYGFPIWHVFLAYLSKIINTNIFILYREITTVLAFLAFFVWYWFFLKVMPTRSLAILALFLFISFHFGPNGYLYTRMPIPDTLNMLIFMPLGFGLALNYIFNSKTTYKDLTVLSLLLFVMGLIHWTQYFYWLLAMGMFAVFYLIFKFRDPDLKIVFKKILLSIFANMLLVAPLLIFIQSKSNIISSNIESYSAITKVSTNDRLSKFDPYFKLSYILLPLLVVFFRKYRRLVFFTGIFLIGPIIFNVPFLYNILRKLFSHVFVNRFYTNLGQWPFIVWAILLGFLLVLIDQALTKIFSTKKFVRYLIDSILALFFAWMVFAQYRSEAVENAYKAVFSPTLFNWLNNNYFWLIPVIVLISFGLYFAQKYSPKILGVFQFSEYKNQPSMMILTLIIVFFLSISNFNHLNHYLVKEFNNLHFFRQAHDPTFGIINPDKFGGMQAIDFIRVNIPAKSVFDTNTMASYSLPTLVNISMSSYDYGPDPIRKYKDLYDWNIPIEKKLTMVEEGKIEYLVYQYQLNNHSSPFDGFPQFFTKIFSNEKAGIYQVNKSAL